MLKAVLSGTGHALPEKVVTSEDLEESMGFDKLKLRKGMAKLLSGVSERRIAAPGTNSSDLAAEAAGMALARAGMTPRDVEMVIFASVSQDLIEPATSNIVMDKANIRNAKGIDVKNACNAFLSSIEIANMYIRCGDVKNVLITSGEVLSTYVKMDFTTIEELRNVTSTFSVGDAGGAIILKAEEAADESGSIQTRFLTYPDTWRDGALLGGGTMYPRDPEEMYAQNESREIMQLNFNRTIEFYMDSLKSFGVDYDDVAMFIPPQITKYLVKQVMEFLMLPPERTICHVGTLGNISTAAFPVALSMAINDGRLTLGSGQKVICFGAANGYNACILYMEI